MSLSRRQFLKRTSLLTAGSFLSPALARNPFLRRAMADALGGKYLIILNADGGNDGLNTVIPTSGSLRATYQAVRNTLEIPTTSLAASSISNDPGTGNALALHPALDGFKSLYDLGRVAVFQGCGYPNPNLSHDEARKKWAIGDPTNTLGGNAGWVGRFLVNAGYGAADISSVNLRTSIAREFSQSTTNVIAMSSLASFDFPYDSAYSSDDSYKRAAYAALHEDASLSAEATRQFIGNAGTATLTASEHYPPIEPIYLADRPTWNNGYESLNSATADNLREIAKIIYAVENGFDTNVCARFFQLTKGGFDTHSNQGAETGRQANLFKEISRAVEQFYADVENMGIANKVLVVWWSEFGRRVNQNDTGTDHGSQAPMFVIGGGVNGSVYGNHPNIASLDSQGNTVYSQNSADPYRSTDFRDVFGTILKHWLSVADPSVIFPADIGSPNTYWTVPDFDLPFL